MDMESGSAVWIALMFVATVMLTGSILDTLSAHANTSRLMSSILDYYTFDDYNDPTVSTPTLGRDVIVWTSTPYYDCVYAKYGCAVDLDGAAGGASITNDTNALTISFFLDKYDGRTQGTILTYGGLRVYILRNEVLRVAANDGTVVRGYVNVGQYSHIIITCENNGTLALYQGGTLVDSAPVTSCFDGNTLTLQSVRVNVDELKIFDTYFTESDAKALHNIESTTQLARVRFIPPRVLDDMQAIARLIYYLMLLTLIGMSFAYFTGTRFEMKTQYVILALLAVALTYALLMSVATGTNLLSFLHIVELGDDAWNLILIMEAIAVAMLATAFLKTL